MDIACKCCYSKMKVIHLAFLHIKQPILFLSGLQDEMVPPSHMEMLYAKAATHNRQCLFVDFPTGMHMDTWLAGGDCYWRTIKEFIENSVPNKKDEDSSREVAPSFEFCSDQKLLVTAHRCVSSELFFWVNFQKTKRFDALGICSLT
ncbi:UNVERIFIED_CONTAM: Alpha/beta hydrolase domain-containing protein WAV2 [Sesamum latifolium]|uniref:Alpha/beta hydrolase domain-containing protein WAV2 n=1 Tax=Sesamum latifolium TaxID=2727402 RepID=A0AAW2U1R7_9LAMI